MSAPAAEIPEPGPQSLTMSVLMTPDMTNFSGRVHGGALMKILDEVAYATASQYSRHYVVTAAVERVVFRGAIEVGELVTFSASVNYTGRTSMEVGIRIDADNIKTGERRHTNSSYVTMVAVDDDGRPCAVPQLTPEGDVAEARWAAALRRREQSLTQPQD